MALLIEQEAPPLTMLPDGTVRIGHTRIPLETVVRAFDRGESAEEIVRNLDTLKLAEVYATLAYVLNHRQEVNAYLGEQERKAAEIRAKMENEPGYGEARAQLVARKEAYLQRRNQESAQ